MKAFDLAKIIIMQFEVYFTKRISLNIFYSLTLSSSFKLHNYNF